MKRTMATILFVFCLFLALNLGSFVNDLIHDKVTSDQEIRNEVSKKVSVINPKGIPPSEKIIIIIGRSTSMWAYKGHDPLEQLSYGNVFANRCRENGSICHVYNFSSLNLDRLSHVLTILQKVQQHFPRIDGIILENLTFMSYDALPLLDKLAVTPIMIVDKAFRILRRTLATPVSRDHASRICIQKSLAFINNEVRSGRELKKNSFINLLTCTQHAQDRLEIFELLFANQMPVKDFEVMRTAMNDLRLEYNQFFSEVSIKPLSMGELQAMKVALKKIKSLTDQPLVFISSFRNPLSKRHRKLLSAHGHLLNLTGLIAKHDRHPNYAELLPDAFHYNPWAHELIANELFEYFFKMPVPK